jgi:hypothetical protein
MRKGRDAYRNQYYDEVPGYKNKALGIEVFRCAAGEIWLGYSGKSMKPDFHYRFSSIEVAREYVADWLKGVAKRHADRLKKKAADARVLKVGDILVSSWGYEQTNVDFYEVVALRGACSVMVRRVREERTADDDHRMTGSSIPFPGFYWGAPFLRRVGHGGNSVRLNSFSAASLLSPEIQPDGTKRYPPVYWTSYA